MKYQKISYKISNVTIPRGFDVVEGYAIDDDRTNIRLCVRQTGHGYWHIDDYDTGCSASIGGNSRELAANAGVVKCMHVGGKVWVEAQKKAIKTMRRNKSIVFVKNSEK